MILNNSNDHVTKGVIIPFLSNLIAILSIFIFASCSLPIKETGTISISILSELDRTISPTITMEIDHYQITGTGPSGANFVLTDLTADSQQITDLAEGYWTLDFEAFNFDNQLIADGSTSLYVYAFTTNTTDVLLQPVTGTGNLDISLTWDETIYTDVTITATVTNQVNESTSLTLVVSGNTATYSGVLDNGYYTLNIILLDGGVSQWGRNEALRVISNNTSQVSYEIVQ